MTHTKVDKKTQRFKGIEQPVDWAISSGCDKRKYSGQNAS